MFHIDCVNLYFRRIINNNYGAAMKMKFAVLSSFLLLIILCPGCSDTPGEKESAEQKALMAECQAAGSIAQVYFKTSIEKSGGGSSFEGYKIPNIIKSQSSGPFAVKQSNGIIRIIKEEKEVLKIEGRPLESRMYNWKIVATVTPNSVLTEVIEN